MPPAAAACDRRRGGAGCILTSAPRCNTWVRDRENLRKISRCAHLEGEEVTYGRSAPARTPADHPWLSQGSSQAERLGDWALVREKVAVRPPPPLRTRAGEATQRGLFVVGRREAPLEASTRGAEAGHPIVASGGETMRKLIRSGTDVIGTGEILHWRRSRVLTSREATEHPESRPPPAHSPRLEHPFLGQEPRSQARGSFFSPQSAMPKARSDRRNRGHVWGGDGGVAHLVVERERVAPRFGHAYLARDRCRTVAAVAASTWARELGTNARDVKKVRVLGVGFVSAALSGH